MQAHLSTYRPRRVVAWLLGLMLLVASGIASADPPSRVARLGYLSGTVSFNAAGDDQWVQATLNRPLTTGDRLWADQGGRAEVQAGAAIVRLSAGTDLSILNLDDRTAQMQLTQGVLNVRLRRSAPDQTYEIDTPNLALTIRQPAAFRIEVDADGNATSVFVRTGQVEVYGEGASYVLDAQHPYRFTGTGLREYEPVQAPPYDDFDRWASERDRAYDRAAATRYVSPDVVGYEDLDAYGTWQSDPDYGNVWVPTRVSPDWAPYREGHWAWVDPWGWTWIDDAPWGFAVTHYGRWAHVHERWCWVPGPLQVRPYYAPALVAFVGGDNFSLSISTGTVGGVAWFPLAPREVYRPAYAVSRTYYENVNVSNTVINTTIINNTYNNTNVTNLVYANRKVPGAVVAVPQTAFVQSQPVAKQAVRVPEDRLVSRPVAIAPAVAPTERSVRGRAEPANRPPAKVIERAVVAREAPPAAKPKFEPSKEAPAARAEEPRRETRPATQGPKPNVKVIAQQGAERPASAPPPAANAKPGGNAEEQARAREEAARQREEQARGREDNKGDNKGPPRPVANAPAPTPRAPTPPTSRETPATPTPEQRQSPEQREPPKPPVPRNAPEQAKPPATVAPPPGQAARPTVPRPPESRGAPEQGDRSQRERAQPAPRPPSASPPQARSPEPAPAARSPEPAPAARSPEPPPAARSPEPPPAARPLPAPEAPRRPEPRDQPRDRAEPPAPHPAAPPPPQAKVSPPPQETPRARVEAPRPREGVRPPAEAARPPAREPAPPPAARAEPRPPASSPPPQAHPAPQPRPNERKKNEEGPDRP